MEYTDIFRRKLGTNQMLLTSSNIRPNMFCKIIFFNRGNYIAISQYMSNCFAKFIGYDGQQILLNCSLWI